MGNHPHDYQPAYHRVPPDPDALLLEGLQKAIEVNQAAVKYLWWAIGVNVLSVAVNMWTWWANSFT